MALEAGHGGIRWNSVSKYIQIMNENNEWVNWKRFDNEPRYIFKSNTYDTTTWGYSADANGRVSKTGAYIGVGSVAYGSGAASYWTTRAFDLTLYNILSVKYYCANTNQPGPDCDTRLILHRNCPTSWKDSGMTNNYIIAYVAIPSVSEQTITADISNINESVYITFAGGNSYNGNYFYFTEICIE